MPLATPAAFFDHLRAGLFSPALSASEVSGCEAILGACAGWRLSWTAYGLGTAYLETAHTMQPVKEVGGDVYFNRMYGPDGNRPAIAKQLGNTEPGDGALFAGRGYVQLTGRGLYAKAGAELDQPLVENPDLALEPAIAAQIMRRGMERGWFTGRTLSMYLIQDQEAHYPFTQARRIINGQDRASDVADYAQQFQQALIAGAWTP